jgi:hypothetical protein
MGIFDELILQRLSCVQQLLTPNFMEISSKKTQKALRRSGYHGTVVINFSSLSALSSLHHWMENSK